MGDDGEELAIRLDSFRNYLLLLARSRLDRSVRGMLEPAELVQQTLVRAYERRDQFHGTSDAQRAAWLRTLLANTITDALRKLIGRRTGLQFSMEESIDESSARLEALLAADQTSPSGRVEREETLLRMANALAAMPEDQRIAIELKHLRGMTLVEVAREMDRTVPSIAGLLQRGLKSLREELGEDW
jgi:RNA polymerase sigma-70 factor (ECF subfamily)